MVKKALTGVVAVATVVRAVVAVVTLFNTGLNLLNHPRTSSEPGRPGVVAAETRREASTPEAARSGVCGRPIATQRNARVAVQPFAAGTKQGKTDDQGTVH
jgi:hypothetical protein